MRYTRQEELAVGSPVAGREAPELEGLIGYFVNSVVLRTDLSGNPGFTDLLGRVRQTVVDAFTHQELPFDQLVAELSPQRDLSRNPLYQVSFALNNQPAPGYRLDGLRAELLPSRTDTAKFDLSLAFTETDGELHGVIEYRTDLFEDATIDRLLVASANPARRYRGGPEPRLAELPLLTEAERRRLLRGMERHGAAVSDGRGGAGADRAAGGADAEGGERSSCGEQRLAYRRAERAGQPAGALAAGAGGGAGGAGGRVRGALGRTLVVALLAMLKAGARMCRWIRRIPRERLAYMLGDAAAPLVLTQRRCSTGYPRGGGARPRGAVRGRRSGRRGRSRSAAATRRGALRGPSIWPT